MLATQSYSQVLTEERDYYHYNGGTETIYTTATGDLRNGYRIIYASVQLFLWKDPKDVELILQFSELYHKQSAWNLYNIYIEFDDGIQTKILKPTGREKYLKNGLDILITSYDISYYIAQCRYKKINRIFFSQSSTGKFYSFVPVDGWIVNRQTDAILNKVGL